MAALKLRPILEHSNEQDDYRSALREPLLVIIKRLFPCYNVFNYIFVKQRML